MKKTLMLILAASLFLGLSCKQETPEPEQQVREWKPEDMRSMTWLTAGWIAGSWVAVEEAPGFIGGAQAASNKTSPSRTVKNQWNFIIQYLHSVSTWSFRRVYFRLGEDFGCFQQRSALLKTPKPFLPQK